MVGGHLAITGIFIICLPELELRIVVKHSDECVDGHTHTSRDYCIIAIVVTINGLRLRRSHRLGALEALALLAGTNSGFYITKKSMTRRSQGVLTQLRVRVTPNPVARDFRGISGTKRQSKASIRQARVSKCCLRVCYLHASACGVVWCGVVCAV